MAIQVMVQFVQGAPALYIHTYTFRTSVGQYLRDVLEISLASTAFLQLKPVKAKMVRLKIISSLDQDMLKKWSTFSM